jgi:hypothetical protein
MLFGEFTQIHCVEKLIPCNSLVVAGFGCGRATFDSSWACLGSHLPSKVYETEFLNLTCTTEFSESCGVYYSVVLSAAEAERQDALYLDRVYTPFAIDILVKQWVILLILVIALGIVFTRSYRVRVSITPRGQKQEWA